MTLKLHNSLSRKKEDFVPADPARVTMYVCGPTVYNYAHIGNARPAVVFDVLFRLLRRLYGEAAVVYARNVTDVDDKINKKAADENVPITAITDRYLKVYHDDMGALGVLPPTIEPRATQHIGAMLEMIAKLVAKGHAYAAEGHVLFDVSSYPNYGALSGRSVEDMIAGARVEVAPYKKNPADFVLWKPSKPGEPVWQSPFGPGRPGWHIECSAMIEEQLGLPIDIHGGGHDLIFPHHENEIAQSVCSHDHGGFAAYWMHNGFLTMDAEKMSKSLGNVLLVHDLVKTFPGEVVRWALLSAHYRAPLDWTDSLLEQSRKNLDRLYGVLQDAGRFLQNPDNIDIAGAEGRDAQAMELFKEFQASLFDDLNTPSAIAKLFALADRLRAHIQNGADAEVEFTQGLLKEAADVLGFLGQDPNDWFKGGADDSLQTKVEALLEARKAARASKDWAAADAIRGELDALGVVVMDGPQGASWRMK